MNPILAGIDAYTYDPLKSAADLELATFTYLIGPLKPVASRFCVTVISLSSETGKDFCCGFQAQQAIECTKEQASLLE